MAHVYTEHQHLHNVGSREFQIQNEGSEMVCFQCQHSEDYQAR